MKKILIVLFLSLSLTACMASSGWAGGMDDFKAGNTALASKDYDKAMQLFTKAIESGELSYKTLAAAYNNRADIWERRNEYDKAIADYTKAIERDSRNATYYYNRALASAVKDDKNRALSDLEKAISLNKAYKNKAKHSRVFKLKQLSNDEVFKKLTAGFQKDLKKIQDKFERYVQERWLNDWRSRDELYFNLVFLSGMPHRVVLTSNVNYRKSFRHEILDIILCDIAKEYYRRTGYPKTECIIKYKYLYDFYIFGIEFDGSECRPFY